MQYIAVYDEDADVIEDICGEKDIPSAELIAGVLEAIKAGDLNIDDWV